MNNTSPLARRDLKPAKLLLLALPLALTACAALSSALGPAAAPLEAAATAGIVALVEAEAKQAGVSPSDPAYQAALRAAQALEAEAADAGAHLQAKQDAILRELRKQRRACPSLDAGAPEPAAVFPSVAPALPPGPAALHPAPAVLPMADAGAAPSRDGGS